MELRDCIAKERGRNPYFPLVPDYPDLTASGKRQARLAVLCDRSTPYKFVLAWDFWRRTYLACSKKVSFYKDGKLESPEFHYDMVHALGEHALNAWAAPRGSAKSTVITLEIPSLLALTRPCIDISLFFSTDKMKQPRFDTLMTLFTENELIIEDFGELKPKRGSATWNHEYLQLTNGSTISGGSVMGKMRGGRPNLLVMDDPENDPDSDSETSRLAVIEKFETILFKKMLPMLKPGQQMFWIGTLIDRKSFLYRATMGDDERFNYWNRVVLRAISHDEETGETHLLWPEMWSEEFLENQKERIGASAFASEYCNEPISAQDRILNVDPRKNEYTVEGDFNWDSPLSNTNIVKWEERIFGDENDHRTYKEMTKPFNELVKPMFRFLLFDYAHGLTTHHDYSCIAICGMDTLATLWVLEMWLGRAKDDTLMRLIYEYGLKWQVRVLGIEAVSIQKTFAEALQEYVMEQEGLRGDRWRARVFPIKYPAKETKPLRMASLEWRFNSARIKYPAHVKDEWPYNQLYAQTQDFTMDLALLQHDDALDTISMSKHIIKTRGSQFKREKGKLSLLERIKKGTPLVKGMPLLSGVDSSEITEEMTFEISKKLHRKSLEPKRRQIERKNPKIIR